MESPTQVLFTERHDSVQTLLLDGSDEPLRVRALQFGARGGVRTTRTPTASSSSSTALLHFGSRSQIKSSGAKETVRLAGQLSQALDEEGFVRMRRRADHLHTAVTPAYPTVASGRLEAAREMSAAPQPAPNLLESAFPRTASTI